MSVRKKASKSRPQFQKITEEMREWAALLSGEVAQWPDIALKPMFGMTAFYRKATMFGAVPATRSIGSPNVIIFKILDPQPKLIARLESDSRVGTSIGVKQKWYSFELSSPNDLRVALSWLSEAYEKAKASQSKKLVLKRKKAR
ncbi:MAG: hypothetical protein JWN45_3116 [Acidobacteriaceae bacterium]|nr:hypothetical protein [Acidobacteriaceae bacterium]